MPWWFVPEKNCWLWPHVLTIWPSPWWSLSSSFPTNQFQSLSAPSTCTTRLPLQSMAFSALILLVSRHWQQLLSPLRQLSQWAQQHICTSGCGRKCHTCLCTFLVPAVPLTRLADSTSTFRMWCNSACKKHNKARCEFKVVASVNHKWNGNGMQYFPT